MNIYLLTHLFYCILGLNASVSEYQNIACYFENEKNWYLAGKYYLLAKQYEKVKLPTTTLH